MLSELLWLAAGFYLTLAMAASGIWLIASWVRDRRASRAGGSWPERRDTSAGAPHTR